MKLFPPVGVVAMVVLFACRKVDSRSTVRRRRRCERQARYQLAHRLASESQAPVSIGLVREYPTSFQRPQTGQHPRQRPAGTRDSVAPDVLRSPVPSDIVVVELA